jgi:glyoxylase-like metal-dependent hydrolase (beta-lactamase superfamily II)
VRVILHGEHLVQLTRFPLLFPINVYLVREDDGFTLIDTGLAGSAAAILRAAADRGGPIRRILLTHAHGDHVGALDALRAALPEAEVAITGRDARFFRGDRSPVAGEPAAKPRGTFPPVRTAPTRDLRHGDRIGSLEVVATPGHTPGHAAFFDRRDATLIAGDALQTRGGVAVAGVVRPLFPFPALATLHGPTALASARALSDLAPSRLAIGHGPVLTDPRPALAEAIEEAARRWER